MAIGQGIYHGFPTHAFLRPEEMAEGVAGRHRVAVVGGGPMGLTVAAGLARHGVPCVVVEPRDSVSFGSRAACISRRSLEIRESFGVAGPMLAKGLAWTGGGTLLTRRPGPSFPMSPGGEHKDPPKNNSPH